MLGGLHSSPKAVVFAPALGLRGAEEAPQGSRCVRVRTARCKSMATGPPRRHCSPPPSIMAVCLRQGDISGTGGTGPESVHTSLPVVLVQGGPRK